MSNKTILVTGSAGMVGSYVVKGLIAKDHTVVGVDRRISDWAHEQFKQYAIDLSDKQAVSDLFDKEKISCVIHLAALAHTKGEDDLSFERYKLINVTCAAYVFEASERHKIPVLFISTVDTIGFVKGLIAPETTLNPVSHYGKSKAMAEGRLKEICTQWNIYRFSPVYTADIKRDIEKRYYLKYPNWAYRIGSGGQFEVLDVMKAVDSMVSWVDKEVDNTIHIIKDESLLDINQLIATEKTQGRAAHVLYFPKWIVKCGFYVLLACFGKCNKTYLVFKVLWPYRTM